MTEAQSLSVIICTRDRPRELERCVQSVIAGVRRDADGIDSVELVIVDDGRLAPEILTRLRAAAADAHAAFVYIPQPTPAGLYPSRLAGIEHSHGEILLFLDDDVVIDTAYPDRLGRLFRSLADVVGIGGVDELDPPRSPALRALHRVFLFDSGHPGRLSASGFAGSFRRWREERKAFTADYLHGCNMAFRRRAIALLPDVEWLRGFSQADDLFISQFARRSGRLLVSPELRVWHHRPMGPTASRPGNPAAIRADVVNMFRILRLERHSGLRVLGFFWTVTCFMLKDLLRPERARLFTGYLRGTRDVLRLLTVGSKRRPTP